MKFITKKSIFIFSLLFLAIPLGAILIQETCDYDIQDWCRSNWSLLGDIGKTTFWPATLFFTVASITYPFPTRVFQAWKRFAAWATPAILLLVYLLIRDTGGGNFFSMDFTLFFLAIIYGLFFLISLAIIAVSWWRGRGS